MQKKTLRNSDKQIHISEHLTKTAADLFAKARSFVKEKKCHAAWTFKGQVYIKKTSDEGKGMLVKSISDLQY